MTKKDLSDMEIECKKTIEAFLTGGDYARHRLNEVLSNIWKHYEVHDTKRQNYIMLIARENKTYSEEFDSFANLEDYP